MISRSPIKAEITDLHVWRVGKGKFACIISLCVEEGATPEEFRQQLSVHKELVHVTVEIYQKRAVGEPVQLKNVPSGA